MTLTDETETFLGVIFVVVDGRWRSSGVEHVSRATGRRCAINAAAGSHAPPDRRTHSDQHPLVIAEVSQHLNNAASRDTRFRQPEGTCVYNAHVTESFYEKIRLQKKWNNLWNIYFLFYFFTLFMQLFVSFYEIHRMTSKVHS